MPELLRMPEVAAGAEEAVLAGWPIAENQAYEAGEIVANVETAKAAVDVEAETSGIILKVLVPAGADVQVGDPIALIGRVGEQVADIDAELARLGIAVGATNGQGAAAQPAVEAPAPPSTSGNGRVFASPLARRMAKEARLDVSTLTGTGPGGRIVRSDVTRAIAQQETLRPAHIEQTPRPAPAAPASKQSDQRDTGGWVEVPHTKIRQLIATRLAESKSTIPHFYLRAGIRVDRLLALRAELNEALEVRISVNDLVLKAVAAAHVAVPDVNVVFTETGLRRYESVDIGVAIASPKGLVTPVVTGVDRLSISALAAVSRDLATRAADGRLKQNELEGGTTSVSNLGMYDIEEFTAIINPPQSSILAVGAARPEPGVDEHGELEVQTKMHVVLSADHRAIDGALAAQWMKAFRRAVENPLRLLA
jgi:pyruvate dehydrogenase E2 component (dihydrolipoamide acetyltransferase)